MKIFKANSYYTDGNYIVEIKRHGNDINGNPLYKMFPISYVFRNLSKVYRNFKHNEKPYYLVQSYNIVADLDVIFEEMERENFPKITDFDPISCGYLETKAYIGG